jgi:hypothetical protein
VADSLALARYLEKPSIWLTITTNPNWPEICSQLQPGQQACDIPTVVCHAFCGQLKKLKQFLQSHFGGLVYEICVVEFQKQGLPYAHIVVKFQQEPPLSIMDNIISTELPDQFTQPELYNKVKRFHIHSAEHLSRPGSYCNQEGQCIYGYPQQITMNTYLDSLGCVHYY